mgnify:CR=1 FL=1
MKGSQMARPDKSAAVAELVEDFRSAQATVLTEYRGLSVTSMKALRRSLGADTKHFDKDRCKRSRRFGS